MNRKASLLILGFIVSTFSYAQLDYSNISHDTIPNWTTNTNYAAAKDKNALTSNQYTEVSKIKVAATGNVVLTGDSKISVYDAESGNTLLDTKEKDSEVPNIFSNTYKEIPGSPFFTIKATRKREVYINSLTGDYTVSKVEKEEDEEEDKSALKKVTAQYVLPKSSSVLYVGKSGFKSGMQLKNLQTGEGWIQDNIFTWKMQEMVIIGEPFELSAEEFLIPLDKALYCINTKTGELKWRTYISIPVTTGYSGPTSKNNPDEKEGWSNTPDAGPAVLFKHVDKSYIYMINDMGLTAYDLETGKEVWKQYRKAKYDSKPIFTPKGLIVLTEKVQLLDYDTGEKLLKKTSKTKGKVTDYAFVPTGIVVQLTLKNKRDQDYTELNVLDPNTGLFKLEEGFETYGKLMKMMPCDKGIFYITDRCIGIWDPKAGKDAFEPIKVSTEKQTFIGGEKYDADYVSQINGRIITTFKGAKSYTYNTETDVLYEIDTKAGTKKEFGEKVSGFAPDFIEARESGIFISSSNRMVLFSYDGKLVYNKHFPPPGETKFEKFTKFADAVTANYLVMNAATKPNQITSTSTISEGGNEYAQTKIDYGNGVNATVNIPTATAKIKQRYEKSKEPVVYNFLVTTLKNGPDGEKEFGLVKVNRDTGKVERVFPFGRNRNPQFLIDEATQKLFYVSHKKLNCYNL